MSSLGADGEGDLSVYDCGGVFDPVDGHVPGEHYGTSHLAWLSAILWHQTREPAYLECARAAAAFHLRTWDDRYRFSLWEYHADFNVLAFQQALLLLQPALDAHERAIWNQHHITSQPTLNPALNWRLMRLLFFRQRWALRSNPKDLLRTWREWPAVHRGMLDDGCIEDTLRESRPIQYHAFSAALLHRYYLLTDSRRLRRRFRAAAEYLAAHVDPCGCFNYKGRGQEQIFGYGCAVYVLAAAASMFPDQATYFRESADRAFCHLQRFQQPDGHFPLVLNGLPDHARIGWYDYHHTTVYNAFCAVWLALAADVQTGGLTDVPSPHDGVKVFQSSGQVVARFPRYFAAVGVGEPAYIADAGLTFQHLHVVGAGTVFTCPGGPDPVRYGRQRPARHWEQNFLAPLFQLESGVWCGPWNRVGRLQRYSTHSVSISMDYGECEVIRQLDFHEDVIHLTDRIRFSCSKAIAEVRWFNLPIREAMQAVWRTPREIEVSEGGVPLLSIQFLGYPHAASAFLSPDEYRGPGGITRAIGLRSMRDQLPQDAQHIVRCNLRPLSL